MAGGQGTRLWPISRKNNPKQVCPFVDNETLLQKTYNRLLQGFAPEKIYITTSRDLKNSILEQLPSFPERNFSLEPCRRETAPALGLALIKIWHRDKNAIFVFINSDNHIENQNEFLIILNSAEKTIEENPNYSMVLGVKPSYPETGYGYIKIGESFNTNDVVRVNDIFKVDKFVEKPDLETAKEYVSSGNYLWDPTLIISRVDHYLNLFKKYLPETYERLMKIEKFIDTPQEKEIIEQEFPFMKKIAIDYGIREKEENVLVVPTDIGWSDVGNWRTVKDILTKEDGGNVIKANCVNIDSKNNLIYASSKKIVGAIGLENMIIVETDDALLVCPKDRAQDVKKIVADIEEKGFKEYL